MSDATSPGKLLAATIELYKKRPREMTVVYLAEQIDVHVNHLSLMMTGRVANPSVNKIEKLYEILSGKTLQL